MEAPKAAAVVSVENSNDGDGDKDTVKTKHHKLKHFNKSFGIVKIVLTRFTVCTQLRSFDQLLDRLLLIWYRPIDYQLFIQLISVTQVS